MVARENRCPRCKRSLDPEQAAGEEPGGGVPTAKLVVVAIALSPTVLILMVTLPLGAARFLPDLGRLIAAAIACFFFLVGARWARVVLGILCGSWAVHSFATAFSAEVGTSAFFAPLALAALYALAVVLLVLPSARAVLAQDSEPTVR
jgi:hypothetical protein